MPEVTALNAVVEHMDPARARRGRGAPGIRGQPESDSWQRPDGQLRRPPPSGTAGFANAPNPVVAVQQAARRALNAKPVATPGGEEMVEEVL